MKNKFKALGGGLSWFIVGIAVCAVLSPFVPMAFNPYLYSIIIYAGINVILAVSLNLVNGLTGQFSMGHAGFMSVGAYVSAFLTTSYFYDRQIVGIPLSLSQDIFFALSLYAGGLASAALGYIVGLPSLRLRGD